MNAALAVALAAAWEERARAAIDAAAADRVAQLSDGMLPEAYTSGLASSSWPGRGQVC